MEWSAREPEIERRIADHLARVELTEVPESAFEQAKRAVLWWTATALEGSTDPHLRPVRDYLVEQGGEGESTVLGAGVRLPAEAAGLFNGSAGKTFEHEDKFWIDHSIGFAVACCVVPAAAASAQAKGGVSGRELIGTVALAIDLEARLIRPLGLGFIPGRAVANATFLFGTFGAAAASARILGLDAGEIHNALGLAHAQAAGNFQGQMEGRGVSIQCGFAVRNGIVASRLAAHGTEGSHGWLAGRAGLYAAHYPASDVDPTNVLVGMGQEYLGHRLGFKAYPCGIVAHPALDAVRILRSRVGSQTIVGIEINGPQSLQIMAEPIEVKRAPRTAVEAHFSIPWGVACVVRDGELTIDHYDPTALADPALRGLAEKVSIDLDDRCQGTTVTIRTTDGKEFSYGPVMVARGHPENPLATEEVEQLFVRSAVRAGVSLDDAESALLLFQDLANIDDVDEIYSHLEGSLAS